MKSHRIEKAARTARLSAAPPTRTGAWNISSVKVFPLRNRDRYA
jgi:hypothetical protein